VTDTSTTNGLDAYVGWLAERGHTFASYEELWQWSIDDLEGFWASVWDYFEVKGSYERVLGSRDMPGAEWFPGARLNYAEHMLGPPEDRDEPAVIAFSQTRDRIDLRSAGRGPGSPGSAWGAATGSSDTCRTPPRRWSRSWRARRWARSGPPARPSSGPAA
jgi:Acetyl-coenzyme A synthetase N-terminus